MTSSQAITCPHISRNLTAHPQGSLRELWAISFPLMLSLMSSSLMYFWDRLLLAQYSLDALNAATVSGQVAAAVQFGFICTAGIAEVFVGQYNGAGKLRKLGQPVWQMIWFSLLSALFFVPAGIYGGPLLFSDGLSDGAGSQFFLWSMIFAPAYCSAAALSAFFIGKGSVRFVTITIIFANIFNVVLAWVLVFGAEPFIAPLGAAGAAIATGIAQAVQAIILFVVFLHSGNRQRYGTGQFRFKKCLFWQCLRVGFPNSLAHTIELVAWAVFFQMMAGLSSEHLAVAAIAQSIFFLFSFITEGVSKGATAIASNYIGAQKWELVWTLLRSGIKFYIGVFFFLGGILVLYPEAVVDFFVTPGAEGFSPSLYHSVVSSCLWVWVFFLFDGVTWLVVGLLTAAGDTKFVLKVGATTIWIFAIIPIYFSQVVFHYNAEAAWAVTAFYGLANCLIYLYRFRSEKWRSGSLICEAETIKKAA